MSGVLKDPINSSDSEGFVVERRSEKRLCVNTDDEGEDDVMAVSKNRTIEQRQPMNIDQETTGNVEFSETGQQKTQESPHLQQRLVEETGEEPKNNENEEPSASSRKRKDKSTARQKEPKRQKVVHLS